MNAQYWCVKPEAIAGMWNVPGGRGSCWGHSAARSCFQTCPPAPLRASRGRGSDHARTAKSAPALAEAAQWLCARHGLATSSPACLSVMTHRSMYHACGPAHAWMCRSSRYPCSIIVCISALWSSAYALKKLAQACRSGLVYLLRCCATCCTGESHLCPSRMMCMQESRP